MTKLSRSKIELFLECPRCFWLEMKHKVKRPPPAPYTLNNAIDYLLKQEFDLYREKEIPHPIMTANKIEAVPWKTPEINKWRHNFTGVAYHHEPTDFLVYGAIDDVWLNPKKEIHVVDYKATGANQHQIYDSYGRQMEIYQWLFRKNKIKVSPIGYFVFARVSKASGFGNGKAILPFDIFVESYRGDDSWIEETLKNAKKIFESDETPKASSSCIHCGYLESASAFQMTGLKKPKILYWTSHSKIKMRQYGFSEARVKRIINSPKRVEEGIADKTIAMMQSAGSKKHPYEVWVMIQETLKRRKIISAWKYPGKTRPGDPLPPEIIKEIRGLI